MNTKNFDAQISEYFSTLHAWQETSELIGELVKTLINDDSIKNRWYHLWSILNSNVANPSIAYVKNLVKAVLSADDFTERQILLPPKNGQKIVTVAWSWKKWVKTINISTPATFVAASCWSQIVKPCSSSTSSLTWSSDFFTHLWWKFHDIERTKDIFQETWIGFFSIEWLIPKFDSIYGWNALTPTALSYALPAIINPVKTDTLLYGLSLENIKTSIHTLHSFWYERVIVANTSDDRKKYIDELWLFKHNNFVFGQYWEWLDELMVWDPLVKLWLSNRYSVAQIMQKSSVHDNVMAWVEVLKWKWDIVHRDIIALNAAAMIYLSNIAWNLKEAYELAIEEIASWKPYDKLKTVIKHTN